MHVIGRIGFMGLGIALVGALSGAPIFAADKPVEDGSKITITSPKDKDKVSDSFGLRYRARCLYNAPSLSLAGPEG